MGTQAQGTLNMAVLGSFWPKLDPGTVLWAGFELDLLPQDTLEAQNPQAGLS